MYPSMPTRSLVLLRCGGLVANLDVSLYTNPKFTWTHMQEIRLELAYYREIRLELDRELDARIDALNTHDADLSRERS